MKIVCISDTHDNHEQVNVPDGDILIHAGDFTCHKEPIIQKTIDFNNWLGKLPHKYKVVIAGNHDTLFEKNPYLARSLITNAVYLEDSGITIDGLNIWGSPYTPFWADWAFNVKPFELLIDHWKLIPENTDVLITHGPPYGICDLNVLGTHTVEGSHCGDRFLLEEKMRLKLKLHVFGHIHEGYGKNGINVNAAQVDAFNNLKNKPIIIDL